MAGSPLFMRDVSLTLKLVVGGSTRAEFNCDVHLAEILPEPGDEVTYQTLCPTGSYSALGKTTYGLHIVAVQRWDAAGLATFLWNNDGAEAEFQYNAHGTTVPTVDFPGMSGRCRLVAGAYGGEAEAYAELDVTMPCTVKPTIVSAAFPTAAEAEAEPAAAAA
jgi:hypothetical protein